MPRVLQRPTIIFVCGWPMSGKTTLARLLADTFCVHHVDIDELRWAAIGQPHPNPAASEELMACDQEEMGGAYRFLFDVIDWHLSVGRSIVATATLSHKQSGQTTLEEIWKRHQDALLRVIQCVPENDTLETVSQMMSRRKFGADGYQGAVNTPERYFEVKARYQPIELPHLKFVSWGSSQPADDIQRYHDVLRYIDMPQVHDTFGEAHDRFVHSPT